MKRWEQRTINLVTGTGAHTRWTLCSLKVHRFSVRWNRWRNRSRCGHTIPELRSPGSLASRSCLFGQNILLFWGLFTLVIGLFGSLHCSVVCVCLACNSKRKANREIVGDGCRVRHLQREVRELLHIGPGQVLMTDHNAQFYTACVICLRRLYSTSNWLQIWGVWQWLQLRQFKKIVRRCLVSCR